MIKTNLSCFASSLHLTIVLKNKEKLFFLAFLGANNKTSTICVVIWKFFNFPVRVKHLQYMSRIFTFFLFGFSKRKGTGLTNTFSAGCFQRFHGNFFMFCIMIRHAYFKWFILFVAMIICLIFVTNQ